MKYDNKLFIFLIEVNIFNKTVQANISKPLRNLCTQFDVSSNSNECTIKIISKTFVHQLSMVLFICE